MAISQNINLKGRVAIPRTRPNFQRIVIDEATRYRTLPFFQAFSSVS